MNELSSARVSLWIFPWAPPWTTSLWSYARKWSLAICSLSFCPPDLPVAICWCVWWHYPPLTNYLQTDPNGYEEKRVQRSLTHLQRLPLLISLLDFPHDFQNSPVSLPLFILNSNVFFASCYCWSRVPGSLTLTRTPKLNYIQTEVSYSKPKPTLNSRNAGWGDLGTKIYLLL